MPAGRSRQTILAFLLCLLAVLAFGQNPAQHHAVDIAAYVPRVSVPDVRGLSPREAEKALGLVGLKPGKISVAAGPGTVGTVQQEEPPQYSAAVRGSFVNLILVGPSQGQTTPAHSDENFAVQVPPLNGLTQNEASNRLEKLNLQLGTVLQGPGKGKIDTIYDQKPGQGSWVKPGTRINVTVVQTLSGPPDVTQTPPYVIVPDLRGQTQNIAAEILAKYGLRPGDISMGSASMPPGTIYAQVPVAGAKVAAGSAVRLYLAQAQTKPLVRVPDLTHRDIGAARTVLIQVGLQVGELSSEESDGTPNSVTSQSPQPGMQVEVGSPVNLVVAQPFPTVEVPNLINHEETQAISLLAKAGLQMGSVSERRSSANSGTVLTQNPRAGVQVQKGTNVDVVVSRQALTGLTVMLGSTNPKKGEGLTIHAHLEPPRSGVSYRFEFGDGQSTELLPTSITTHTYNSSGEFQLLAFARIGTTEIPSERVTVLIPGSPIGLIVGISSGALVLAFGGFVLYGRTVFHRFVRVVPALDPGTQRISSDAGASWGLPIQVHLQEDPGKQSIYVSKGNAFRKEDL
jgi:beta-lactam-binding protein with PASTA domain